jgi:hypothetical protein
MNFLAHIMTFHLDTSIIIVKCYVNRMIGWEHA